MTNIPEKNTYRCYLQALSPIHIGCDEVYEPMGFVVDTEAQCLIIFDTFSFIGLMEDDERRKFSEICRKGTILSILELYKFFQGKAVNGRRVRVCEDFVKHYGETLSLPGGNQKKVQNEINRFTIERTAFNSDDERPYIPGSAIKGAIRTSYLNTKAKEKKISEFKGKYAAKGLEKDLLDGGSFETDPFRMVKISDFRPVGNIETSVVYCVNEKKKPSEYDARGPYQILEVISPGSLFSGYITVEQPHPGARIRKPVSDDDLFVHSKKFYHGEKTREDGELNRIGIPSDPYTPKADKENLIRLGRHSGAESITIDGHRSIRIMTDNPNKPKYLDHATTIWLASNYRKPIEKKQLRSFGWAIWGEMTTAQDAEFSDKESAWQEDFRARTMKIQIEAQKKLEIRRKAAEDAKTRLDKELRKKKEIEKRKAMLAAMSPEERNIEILSDPNVAENKVVEIFNRIDEFSDQNKVPLARALKEYWIKHGKWEKKNCSKKQLKKVQKIINILRGE